MSSVLYCCGVIDRINTGTVLRITPDVTWGLRISAPAGPRTLWGILTWGSTPAVSGHSPPGGLHPLRRGLVLLLLLPHRGHSLLLPYHRSGGHLSGYTGAFLGGEGRGEVGFVVCSANKGVTLSGAQFLVPAAPGAYSPGA